MSTSESNTANGGDMPSGA